MKLPALFAIAISLLLLGCTSTAPQSLGPKDAIVYKSESCGCCSSYTEFLDSWGFSTTKVNTDMDALFAKYNIPRELQSCHLTQFQNYFVIGHVPKEVVDKLMAEQPDIDGISLPDMPTGTPGMPGPRPENLTIYSIKGGKSGIYMQIK